MTSGITARQILSQLEQRIADISGDQRMIRAASAVDKLSAVLREISDTILPRVLVFENGDAILRLTVANGRILQSDDAGLDAAPCDVLGQSFRRFAEAEGPLSVRPIICSTEAAPDDAGCPSDDLQAYCLKMGWLGKHEADDAPQGDAPFEDMLRSLSAAEVILSGAAFDAQVSGDASLLPDVQALLALKQDIDRVQPDEAGGEALWFVLPAADPQTHATSLFVHPDKTLCHAVAAADLPALAAAWESHAGRRAQQ